MPPADIQTRVFAVDPWKPDPETIATAAAAIRSGQLVAFPTETVYGLGANALDEAAVAGIFTAKGRPAHNPVIVHIASADAAVSLSADWNATARTLTAAFWPGPLTLVTRRAACIPDIVTAGGDTVALRVPAHPVALALLMEAGVPIAAPSANRSSHISPTTAQHVLMELGGRIHLILDAGPTECGLESTVVDCTGPQPRILRPGPITPSQIGAALGLALASLAESGPVSGGPLRSPGLLPRHYAPSVPLTVTPGSAADAVQQALAGGQMVGWLALEGSLPITHSRLRLVSLPRNAQAYAHALYAALRQLEAAGVDCMFVDAVPAGEEWLAVRDRLSKAGGQPRQR